MVTTKKILIVDDEPDTNLTLKKMLEEYQQKQDSSQKLFEIDTFSDPELALSSFKPGWYDLLIVDVKMPKIHGFELYDKLKKIDNKVKVCFISVYDVNYQAIREMFPYLEIECFIPKPVEIDELVQRINAEVQK